MNIDINSSAYAQKAMELFKEGYNCAQSVFLAFEDKYDCDHAFALKLSSSFGGGMGRLREVWKSILVCKRLNNSKLSKNICFFVKMFDIVKISAIIVTTIQICSLDRRTRQ